MSNEHLRKLIRILAAAVFFVVILLLPVDGWLRFALFIIDYLLIGYDILWEAVEGIAHGEVFDECFLMAVATLGAVGLSVWDKSYNPTEAVAVMLFYQLGEWFQDLAVDKSRDSIAALASLRPDTALLETENGQETVAPDYVPVGSIIIVSPGERIPLDGEVTDGSSSLDTSALTGESMPRFVTVGDDVLSGCINQSGQLRIRTTRLYGESVSARILDLIESENAKKSTHEDFVTRFSRVYTPIVCAAALLLAVVPPLVLLLTGAAPAWQTWIYRALTFLVISCPCALVVSVPLTFFAALGGAGKSGILIKGSGVLETLAKVDTVLFDKTGTLTEGKFRVKEVLPVGIGADELLALAASAECASAHPIAVSLREAYGKEIRPEDVRDIREIGGHGVTAVVNGHTAAVGSGRLLESLGIAYEPVTLPGTVVYAACDGVYRGCIVIADSVKDSAREAVAALNACGVTRTVMLTGDNESAAAGIAAELGLSEHHSGLLPVDKAELCGGIMSEPGRTGKVAFVGDGLNDAPVLTRADVGIAMGGTGSDAAIETADAVLMNDDPRKIARAVKLSRRALRIVYENIGIALGIKAVVLLLAAFGISDMGPAVFADVGVLILCVLNALRGMRVPK